MFLIGFARWYVDRSVRSAKLLATALPILGLAAILYPAGSFEGGWRLPLVWWVAPFSGWLTATGCVLGLWSAAQAVMAFDGASRGTKWRQSAFWAAAAGVGVWTWKLDGFQSAWLKGGVVLSAQGAVLLFALATATAVVATLVLRSARSSSLLRRLSTHTVLIAGSLVFGLPFFWLLVTSFKEDRDMASTEGLVWVPRVTETAPYSDPDDPVIESTFQGQIVQGSIIRKNPDGSALLDIIRPGSMRGMTFTANAPLKVVPKDMPVVAFERDGQKLEALTVKDFGDGGKEVRVLRPDSRKGEVFTLAANQYELVRHIGLRTQNYVDALEFLPPETMKGLVYLRNSMMLALLTVLGTLLSSSLVAYAFARLRFPNKDLLFGILLATMALPAAVTMLPTFLIYRWLGWVDTLLPLWVPSFLGSAFNIFLLRQFFATIPLELEDAAKIDGCSYLSTYWRVMLPQIQPAMAFVAVTTAMQAWNNFMGPLVYVNSPEKMPIAYAVQLFQGDRVGEPGLLMAFATMGMAPILILFFFTQKYFVENVALSGLGGR